MIVGGFVQLVQPCLTYARTHGEFDRYIAVVQKLERDAAPKTGLHKAIDGQPQP